MKNNKLLLSLIQILCTTFLIFILASCNKQVDTISVSNNSVPSSVKEIIYSLNFDTANIQDIGDYYVVEGDIRLDKKKLNTYNTPSVKISSDGTYSTKQAKVSSLINIDNVHIITVRVDATIPTTIEDNWRNAVQQAINEWNNTSSYVHMTYTTSSTADITVSDDQGILYDGDYNSFALAQASWPASNKPGPTIIVNLNAGNNRTFTDSQKKYNMVHELGHCLGLRHTNWSGLGESSGLGITGTPNTGSNPDPNSVMNGGTATNSWVAFSSYDLIAIKTLYPIPSFIVTIAGPTKGNNSGTYTWTATAKYGVAPYTYHWYRSLDEGETYTVSFGSTASIKASLPLDMDLYLKVVAESSNGNTTQEEIIISNTDGDSI